MAKTHVDWLEVTNYSANPSDTDADRAGLASVSGSLKFFNGTSWTTIGTGETVTTWDALYDLDKALTIDSDTVTFTLTHATNDGLTLAAQAGAAGAVLKFNNSGSGNDVDGSGDLWSVNKSGQATFARVDLGDDEALRLGASQDAVIQWVSGSSHLDVAGATNFDGNMTIEAPHTLTIAGSAGSTVATITAGDMVMSDGSLAITDADDAASFSVTNATLTTGNMVTLTADAATSGSILYIDNGGASLTSGYYINCNDDGTADFTVGADGATTITTATATTAALTVTGVQTSQDMVTFDNTGGVIASGKAVLLLDAGGAVASGGNILRVAPTGTPNAGAIGIEFAGASKDLQAMKIDVDNTSNSAVLLNSGGAIADNKAILEIVGDGTPAASGSNLLRIDGSGLTATNGPTLVEIVGTGIDANALTIDIDNTDQHAVSVTGSGALSGASMLYVDNDGTPAASTDAVAEFTFTGTATNNPIVLNVNNGTADAAPLVVTSNVAAATRSVGTFIQDSTTGAKEVITLQQDDVSEEFIAFNSTAGSGNAVDLTNTTPAAVAGSVLVTAVDGTAYRIALYAAAGWS